MSCPMPNQRHPELRELNHPLDEIIEGIEERHKINPLTIIFQKFTCANCGSRQTMGMPNILYTSGKCEECGFSTDIKKEGCNFTMVIPKDEDTYHRMLNRLMVDGVNEKQANSGSTGNNH